MAESPSSTTQSNSNKESWREFFIQVFERVADGGCVSACMPLPSDESTTSSRKKNAIADANSQPPKTITTTTDLDHASHKRQPFPSSLVDSSFEEDEIARIDQLYGVPGQKFPPRPVVTKVSKKRLSSTSSAASSRSSVSFMNPFPLFPKPSATRDARSFDSLARSTDTSLFHDSASLERELPSFGTHRTYGEDSLGMSSYSQTYSPGLSSYLYRCRERSLPEHHYKLEQEDNVIPQVPSQEQLLRDYRSTSTTSTSTQPTSNQHSKYQQHHTILQIDPFVSWHNRE
jgi:hypothetical protein